MTSLALTLAGAVGAVLLSCECCTAKRHPRVTAVEESLSSQETVHRLRQFHGHLGPYALLGYRLGLWILQRLSCAKYFGARVTVAGPDATPFTCMLDGLQMATGYTLGKGNLKLVPGGSVALFDVEIVTEDGRHLAVQVPRRVENTFDEWLGQGLGEEKLFEKVMAAPASQWWEETPTGPRHA